MLPRRSRRCSIPRAICAPSSRTASSSTACRNCTSPTTTRSNRGSSCRGSSMTPSPKTASTAPDLTAQQTRARRRIDGVLLLDKPTGLSSNAALQRAKRLYRAQKAGHTGTLDPLASGLLPICFGEATKFAQALLDADKAYVAVLHLGVTTETGDSTGAL